VTLRYLSVCSGIEAASVAWHPLGWEPAAFAEIDPFPSAVLAHHYPSVPNYGDFTTIQAEQLGGAVELLVGGTPCQSFSVAGLRRGLADDRGNLALQFALLAERVRPRWVLWENVPGVLSSNGGRDFGSILGALEQLGYGWSYRVLDAQHFGVPQRRRRVFVVGCLGDWRGAAAVLFERHSLQGSPAPRREAGEGVAGTFKACAGSGGWSNSADHASAGYMIPAPTAPTVPARRTGGGGLGTDFDCDGGLIARCITTGEGNRLDAETTTLVAHTLRSEGFDASEDGTGRGTPLVPCAFNWQSGGDARGLDPKPTAQLQRCQTPAVAFADIYNGSIGDVAATLATQSGDGVSSGPSLILPSAVRRLTPRECERLQGFPDDYTLVPYRKKPAADGPRYKALGNSMAVPVMRWIGERIQMVEDLRP
jgi:DNA (cytosine-5)-methyltransferase 1